MLVIKRLRLALKSVPLIILFCKAYLGLRPVFSSSFFPPCPLRMELIWFCPMLKDETMPNPNSRKASLCFLTNMGIRMLLNTLPSQQLSIVSHAKLVLSIIKFSKRVFFLCWWSKNLRNCLLELLHERGKPFDVESLIGLMHWRSEVIVELQDTASSFRSEGKVLNKFSHSAIIHFWLPLSRFHPTWSCTFRTWITQEIQVTKKDFGRVLSTGYTRDNVSYAPPKYTVSGERANDWQDSTVLTAGCTAGAGSVCKDSYDST